MTRGLSVGGLAVERGGVRVVFDCSLEAPPGSITVLLGPNGAGKTTLLEAISGVLPARSGSVALGGERLDGLTRHRRARLGLAHVEQGRAVFGGLTVRENVIAAAADRSAADEALAAFPELAALRDRRAGMLSGGEQQMLVLARALASRPRMLLVDEMSLGLAPRVARRLMQTLRELADGGLGVLVVEQFARLALELGDRAYVLRRGSVAHSGDCATVLGSPELLQAAYLGS